MDSLERLIKACGLYGFTCGRPMKAFGYNIVPCIWHTALTAPTKNLAPQLNAFFKAASELENVRMARNDQVVSFGDDEIEGEYSPSAGAFYWNKVVASRVKARLLRTQPKP